MMDVSLLQHYCIWFFCMNFEMSNVYSDNSIQLWWLHTWNEISCLCKLMPMYMEEPLDVVWFDSNTHFVSSCSCNFLAVKDIVYHACPVLAESRWDMSSYIFHLKICRFVPGIAYLKVRKLDKIFVSFIYINPLHPSHWRKMHFLANCYHDLLICSWDVTSGRQRPDPEKIWHTCRQVVQQRELSSTVHKFSLSAIVLKSTQL